MRILSFNQALHGYDDGHQLLAASLDLSGAVATTVLILSDVSGSAVSVPKIGYMTGYPLQEAGMYAVGVTWGAPEMPRPGCVWTHTIFIPFEDLAIIDDCLSLRRLFRRPQQPKNLRHYERRVDYLNVERSDPPAICLRDEWSRVLIDALYSNPTKVIVVRPTCGFDGERYILAIWEQQWPGLRRSFRFCTHSVGELSTPVGAFDVSVMPQSAAQAPPANDPRVVVVELETHAHNRGADWVSWAAEDLEAPGGLRRLLRGYAADVSAGREAFAPLCHLFGVSEPGEPEPERVMKAAGLLDQGFSPQGANTARRVVLRKAILGASEPGPETKGFVLRHMDLLTPEDYGSCLIQASRWLFRHCLPDAWLLFEPQHSGYAFGRAFIVDASEEEIVNALGFDARRTTGVLELRPEFLTSRSFWRSSEAVVAEAINHVAAADRLSAEVLSALLRAGAIELALHLSRKVSAETLFSMLVAVSDSDPPEIATETWGRWLTASCPEMSIVARLMTEGTSRTLVTLARLARAVKPAAVPNELDRDPWVTAYENANGALSAAEQRHFFCFLLARAFSQASKQPGRLLAIALDKVYALAEQSNLGEGDWAVVSETIRSPRWWLAWDRCGTLRFAVAVLCRERMITAEEFLNCTDNDHTFRALVDELSEHWWGRNFLQKVARQGSRNSPRITAIKERL